MSSVVHGCQPGSLPGDFGQAMGASVTHPDGGIRDRARAPSHVPGYDAGAPVDAGMRGPRDAVSQMGEADGAILPLGPDAGAGGDSDQVVKVPAGTVREGFQQLDIGAHIDDGIDPEDMLTKGTVRYEAGTWTLTGSGEGFIHGWDQGNLVVTEAAGDLTITAHVDKLELVEAGQNLDGAAQALLNVRQSLDAYEDYSVIAAITPDKLHFMARQQDPTDQNKWWYRPAFPSQWPPPRPAPHWIRLTRRGNTFTAYVSEDGTSFQPFAELEPGKGQPINVPGMTENVYVGLGCSARNDRNYVPNGPGGRKDASAPHLLRSARCVFSRVSITTP